MDPLTFHDGLLTRQAPRGIDAVTTLAHFSIITYFIDPDVARQHVHPRFELDLVTCHGRTGALLSVVPFLDLDFRLARAPWPKWRFEQTNYRIYVTDTETGEHAVWFLGTSLNSVTVNVPRFVWKLPWHKADIHFDCDYDRSAGRYRRYAMTARRSWANAFVELHDTGEPVTTVNGFDDCETGLVLLTHPMRGFYTRRDGRLGSYSIWHDRLHPTVGQVVTARFDLLDRLALTNSRDVSNIHSVFVQPSTEFTIYLPPRLV